MTYKEENDRLMQSILRGTFFNAYKTYSDSLSNLNFKSLEMFISPVCNQSCEYCYLIRYGNGLYPKEIRDNSVILHNVDLLIDWIIKNEYKPKIDVFSGEIFSLPIGFEVLEKINRLSDTTVVIPTNFTFIPEQAERVKDLMQQYKERGNRLFLSASIDGKYCEGNRPSKNKIRDDEYYDKVFEFCYENNFAFHPMIYSHRIECWKENFKWFIDMFKKHGFKGTPLYLLEVRNEEWTDSQIEIFEDFVYWLTDWCVRNEKNLFKEGFNILSSMLSTIGRGIGCGIQSALYVRMGDLAILPCHRTSYKGLNYGKFIVDGEIVEIESENIENMVATYSFNADTLPVCESCMIKHVCSHGCLGCQFETVGDMFTPNPKVCQLEHAKVKGFVRALVNLGIYNEIVSQCSKEKQINFGLVKENINGK